MGKTSKSTTQCNGIIKRTWAKEEDLQLIKLINSNAPNKEYIRLFNKSPKQCKERYKKHLDPINKYDKLTDDDIKKINELHAIYGNQWSIIGRIMSRSDNQIKNYWHSQLRKNKYINHSIINERHNMEKFNALCYVASINFNLEFVNNQIQQDIHIYPSIN